MYFVNLVVSVYLNVLYWESPTQYMLSKTVSVFFSPRPTVYYNTTREHYSEHLAGRLLHLPGRGLPSQPNLHLVLGGGQCLLQEVKLWSGSSLCTIITSFVCTYCSQSTVLSSVLWCFCGGCSLKRNYATLKWWTNWYRCPCGDNMAN